MSRLFACVLPILLLCGFRPAPSSSSPVALAVIDREDGREQPQYPHRGQRWVEGEGGHRYALRLHNTSNRRVLVVLSVDGINAITGATASPDQSGYVLDPWQSTEIGGWRKSSSEVAQFVFTDHGDSYASRTGRPANVGVIGIAVFEEARPIALQQRRHETQQGEMPAPAAAAEAMMAKDSAARSASANRQQLGTGHGEREWSASTATTFERASRQPLQVSELRYDTQARLLALGVLPRRSPGSPQAFPGSFVPDPPLRRR
ncbi:MAG: hypothetical protein ACOH1V_05815 [Stenotrophomonas sp.]